MDVERGAAWRRRQRRLRSWWRHEQQTVAAVLATVNHRSHSKVGTANDAPRSQKKVTSTRVGPAEYYELSSEPRGGRQWLRHERLSVAMALAENNHHTALRRQTMARAGGGARDVLCGRVLEDALPQAAGARYFAMDAGEDVGEAPAAERPAPLLEVRPQERVQQHTVEQIVDPVPLVPLLHDVVPQMVEQLVDILAPLDFRVAEQVIEVPKIVCPPRAARTVLRAPQTAEQLVEVPTIISCSSLLQQTLEHTTNTQNQHTQPKHTINQNTQSTKTHNQPKHTINQNTQSTHTINPHTINPRTTNTHTANTQHTQHTQQPQQPQQPPPLPLLPRWLSLLSWARGLSSGHGW